MNKIMIGQLMLFTNIAIFLLANNFIASLHLSDFAEGFIAFIGCTSSVVNLFFAIVIQLRGYQDSKVMSSTIWEDNWTEVQELTKQKEALKKEILQMQLKNS